MARRSLLNDVQWDGIVSAPLLSLKKRARMQQTRSACNISGLAPDRHKLLYKEMRTFMRLNGEIPQSAGQGMDAGKHHHDPSPTNNTMLQMKTSKPAPASR